MITRTSESESGRPLTCYIHGPVIDELLCRVTETNTVYCHHDGLGSTVALTDSTGTVVENYTYDVYGQPSILSATYHLLPTSSVTNRFLFTGREYLADLALYDYRHRFYSPSLGRFLQTDPLRFDAEDVNLYRYCENNPLSCIDPDGFGKIRYFIRTVKGIWKQVGKERAMKELVKKKDVKAVGKGSSKEAKKMGKEIWGNKNTRHDAHEAGKLPHYQYKNGGKGHIFYQSVSVVAEGLATKSFVKRWGENGVMEVLDFFNPLADASDIADLLREIIPLANDTDDYLCEE